jgi:hypothetical protein
VDIRLYSVFLSASTKQPALQREPTSHAVKRTGVAAFPSVGCLEEWTTVAPTSWRHLRLHLQSYVRAFMSVQLLSVLVQLALFAWLISH